MSRITENETKIKQAILSHPGRGECKGIRLLDFPSRMRLQLTQRKEQSIKNNTNNRNESSLTYNKEPGNRDWGTTNNYIGISKCSELPEFENKTLTRENEPF